MARRQTKSGARRQLKRYEHRLDLLERRVFLTATLVQDINTANGGSTPSSSPTNLVNVNGRLFYTATDSHGVELWTSDGTSAGTRIVKDINPNGSNPSSPSQLTAVGNTVYFTANANTTTNLTELWKSDGTPGGTTLVRAFSSNYSTFPNIRPFGLTNLNGTLLFAASDGVHGTELWKSDGTPRGTVMLKDIRPNTNFDSFFESTTTAPMVELNGKAYFQAYDAVHGFELWQTDGTEAGTVLFKDILPGNNTTFAVRQLTSVNGKLYFSASANGTSGEYEPWVSDGTPEGTVLLKDILPGTGSSNPSSFTAANGFVFFSANDGVNGTELWRTNGSPAGTVMVKDITAGSTGSTPVNLTSTGSRLYFTITGSALWTSDGTDQGTVGLKNPFGTQMTATSMVNLGGTLMFAYSGVWRTDGTLAGTSQVMTVTSPTLLTTVNDRVYFSGSISHGTELFKTDGTPSGSMEVRDAYANTLSSSITSPIALDGMLYFGATDGATGIELSRADTSGASLVKDINSGSGSSITADDKSKITNVNGTLYFAANNGTSGIELWKSDGTAAGTVMVKDINPGSGNSSPNTFVNVNGTLFFFATDGVTGNELWRSDGTAAGTVLVKDIEPGSGSSGPLTFAASPVAINGVLYFRTQTAVYGSELWRSDGTAAGTLLLKDVWGGSSGSAPAALTNLNGTLFFSASDPSVGRELFKSDGTTAGTVLVKDVVAGGGGSSTVSMIALGSDVIFTADTGVTRALWRSDGTAAGTVRLSNTLSGAMNFARVGNRVFFQAFQTGAGAELAVTDGTATGTLLVKDLNPGTGSSSPTNLTAVGDTLFCQTFGTFWKSDGTAGGTVPVIDNLDGSQTSVFCAVNDTLFFSAADWGDSIGSELYCIKDEARSDVFHIVGDAIAGNNDVIRIVRDGSPSGSSFHYSMINVFVNNTTNAPNYQCYVPTLAQLVIDGFEGNNQITIDSSLDNVVPGLLKIVAGGGNDTINYIGANGDGAISIQTGAGSDVLNVTAGKLLANDNFGTSTSSLTVNLASGTSATFNASQRLAALNLTNSTATLTSGGDKVLAINSISFVSGGKLDLTDNDMIARAMTYNAISALVKSGYKTGNWLGTGITSSTAAAFAQIDGSRAIGVIDNADWGYGTFSGQTVSSTDILVKFTYTADSNLDGLVDNDDFGQFLYGFNGGGAARWLNGDFDFNGVVDNDDFGWFLTGLSAFNASGGQML